MREIYVDNAATTRVSDKVLEAMIPFFKQEYGNPSSIYQRSRTPKLAIEKARKQVADAINAQNSEIFFTSGGTESDNWAIKSIAHTLAKKGKKHIITSEFEHHAVLHTVQALEKEGFKITYLPVYDNGIIKIEDLEEAIQEDTALVSIMYANNEIGTVLPIAEIGALCRSKKILFHTDAVQAVGNIEIDVVAQNIDLLSISAHKLNGPKGVGALYCRKGTLLLPYIHGGAQERGKRSGTENVPGIVGLGVAIEDACSKIKQKQDKLIPMRDKLINELLKIERTRLNGDPEKRLCGTLNISFEGIEGESLLLMLDMKGINASSGSACTSGSLDPSHVLLALGLTHDVAHGSLRISLGMDVTEEDVDYILDVVPKVVNQLRAMSPLWEKIKAEESK